MLRSSPGHSRTHASIATPRRGFTLVELMMSLVMVLLLTLAVTQIFRVTVTTIGKGNATGEVIRGLDSARIALQIDFAGTDAIAYSGFTDQSGILPTDRQPAIIISSTSMPAFMSERDMQVDSDYDPLDTPANRLAQTTSLDSDNDGIDDTILGPYTNGRRWFRLDTLSFFTGGHGESQKNLQPGGGGFYGDTTSDESWVWYGHGRLYDGEGELNLDSTNQYPLPGEGTADTNPNNFFANQFGLLRTAMLLRADQFPPNATATQGSTVLSDDGDPILHVRPLWDTTLPTDFTAGFEVSPLEYESPVALYDGTTNQPYPPYEVQDSRVDVAGVTPAQYRERLRAAQSYGTAVPGSGEANGPLKFSPTVPRPADPPTWYNRIFARTHGNVLNQNAGRFWINPLVLKPLDAGEVSQASSYLLGGATEFIVEYAGDFLTQDVVGATLANLPDGVVDFTVDTTGTRHIRFYGMPRDVDGLLAYVSGGTIYSIPGPAAQSETVSLPGSLPDSNALLVSTDTRPLADYVLAENGMTVNTGYPFEKRLPGEYNASDTVTGRDTISDYQQAYLDGDINDWSYLAAWGPGDFDGDLYPNTTHASDFNNPANLANPEGKLRPSLIRVIVSGMDRQNRLEEPISMELIFRVPAE